MIQPFIGFLLAASTISPLGEPVPMPVGQKIIQTAIAYEVDPMLALDVFQCESSLRHEGVRGDGGKAYGIGQFHRATFDAFKKEAGVPSLNYYSENDQIELTILAIKSGYGKAWTCYRWNIGKYL